MAKTVTFIGKTKANETEQAALNYLGRIIAAESHKLIANPNGVSNNAIVTGYRARGLEPQLVTRNVLSHVTDALIVFADESLLAQLEAHDPTWKARSDNTIVLDTEDRLYTFVDLALDLAQHALGANIDPF